MRFILILTLLVSPHAHAAMARVIGVLDSRTLVIERKGQHVHVPLAGVQIINEPAAEQLLRWTVRDSWVLLEPAPTSGEFFVYRSPDALFVNRELVERGYARATLRQVDPEQTLRTTYLGELDPAPREPPPAAKKAMPKKETSSTAAKKGGTPRSRKPK